MKIFKLTLLILAIAALINFVRSGETFHIARTLPFAAGADQPPLYEFAGIAMLGITLWGFFRLVRRNSARTNPPPHRHAAEHDHDHRLFHDRRR